ncbi:MAG TPA: S41 family peptidase [Thermomicrobiales bacterium]|nr:S41 family peptidase [Thermomicrobiales bacterium]
MRAMRESHASITAHLLVAVLVAALLVESVALSPFSVQPLSSAATPGLDGDTRLYVGHDAQLTAEMPTQWQPDMTLTYDYAGVDGFIGSESIALPDHSLDEACAAVAASERFSGHGVSKPRSWRNRPACEIGIGHGESDSPSALVFAHPHPAADGHNQYVSFFADSAHFERMLASISFDPSNVSADAYLDAAIDFAQTHSLWRDRMDWALTRRTAHDLLSNQPVDQGMGRAHRSIQYVVSEIWRVGGDGHNWFGANMSGNAEASRSAPLPLPTGELLSKSVGYLAVPGFGGDSDQALQFVTAGRDLIKGAAAGGACGWIVDLRDDIGGNMYPMVGGVAPLLPAGAIMGFHAVNGAEVMVTYDGKGGFEVADQLMDPAYSPAVPVSTRLDRYPVAVLIGPKTASAGEATALAFAGRDRTRFFGATTARFATAPVFLHLFDGAMLKLSAAWMVGPHGAIYPNAIAPDVPIASGAVNQASSNDTVVQAAREWLYQQPECAEDGERSVER